MKSKRKSKVKEKPIWIGVENKDGEVILERYDFDGYIRAEKG